MLEWTIEVEGYGVLETTRHKRYAKEEFFAYRDLSRNPRSIYYGRTVRLLANGEEWETYVPALYTSHAKRGDA